MTTVGNEESESTKLGEGMRSLRRSSSVREDSGEDLQRPLKRNNSNIGRRDGGMPPVYARAFSSSALDVETPRSTVSLVVEQDANKRGNFRRKSMAWKEPMLLLQRMSNRRMPALFQTKAGRQKQQQQPSKGATMQDQSSKLSQWAQFWRKLRFDGDKKVHAAKTDWLNYDAQSYAMNFEAPHNPNFHHMPKISGPGAREIVTVLLKRSSSANRNSGSILIPKPVLVLKQVRSLPLWKRRSVEEPSSLDIKVRVPSMRRRSNAAAA